MPMILLSKSDEEYLQKCATQMNFAYGIIIGQKAEPGKYVIVHLAKNGEEEIDFPILNQEEGAASHGPQKVEDIDLQALSNQWLSAHKMIPGSFNILGIFVTGIRKDHIDEQSEEFKTAKRLFYDMHNLLNQSHQFKSTEHENTEYLYLAYSSASKKAIGKMYNYVTNGGSFSPMDCRFVEKPFDWLTFESSYELDDVFPILDSDTEKINIETQFQATIETVRKHLAASEIFIQNENVENNQILETYVKQKRQGGGKFQTNEEGFKATIYLPVKCQANKSVNPVQVKEFNGTIRLHGVISSRVWCNPKNTMGDVKRFIREDILRSLMARIQVYCDGLTEPNISSDAIFISEPPRRVYFNVNTSTTGSSGANIQFSEYIFRGETPTVAAAQAKQILDLDIATSSIVGDVESLPDDDSFSDTSFELQTAKQQLLKLAEESASKRDLTRTMYMLGISVALLVLIISIVMHYFFK
ncbi:odr-4-like protein [Lucilia cuprina]|uniref:Odr-4-like protein n=1 Tax=Lucilia cuprina TaxID=7375 RepID=A0A0L0C3N8_LUCCU|nr:Protein odr-4 like protein [Lucilia cuprina]KNC26862.1 odr-4-like protein [Lucilia cuprina]